MTSIKTALRTHYRTLRNMLKSDEIQKNAQNIQEKIKSHRVINQAQKIGAYLPINNELDLTPSLLMLKAQGKAIFVPILHPWRPIFWFAPWHPNTKKNKFGIPEPSFASKDLRAPWELDIILMPLLAADKNGHRLGMGKGYYDQSLAFKHNEQNQPPYLIGCAYAFQLAERIPYDDHDIKLDELIITST